GTASAAIVGNDVCITYTPNTGFNGIDSVCVVVCDGAGACDSAVLVINVIPANDPPIVPDSTVTIPEDSTITVCLPITDVDGPTPFTLGSIGCFTNGTATAAIVGNDVCITYTPDAGFSSIDSVCVTVCDGAGLCDSAVLVINVIPDNNNPPFIPDTSVTINQDSTITICVPFTDADGVEPYTATVGCVDNGTAIVVVNGMEVCVTYTPNPGFTGMDTACVTICDSAGACSTGDIIITVLPLNKPPFVPDTAIIINQDTTITICLPITDEDGVEPYSVTVGCASDGIASAEIIGMEVCITYTPNFGYNGMDSLCITVCDSAGACYTSWVVITIEPIKLFIPSGFSPDGDGVNDYFVITDLNHYPNNHIWIYNRWGNLIYDKKPYDNTWDGKRNVNGITYGEDLPEGTYFYLLDLGNNTPGYQGYVIIKR
ncbi:MAG: Ig-like domain-containing protein, partial [Bacteroidota bacterium]